MKKRFAVILCIALTMVLVTGCGENIWQTIVNEYVAQTKTDEATDEEASETTEEETAVETTETLKEETVPETAETAKEETISETVEAAKEETTSETVETGKTETSTVTQESKEDKTEATANETVAATTVEENTVSNEETTPAPEPVKAYVIDKYIADNDFTDFEAYGYEMGAFTVDTDSDEWNVDFKYGSYFVSIGTNRQDAEYCYIGIGGEDNSTLTYACLVRYIGVPTLPLFKSGTFFPTSAAHMLEDTINYMKAHPDPNTKPSISGMNFESWAVLLGG